MNEISRKTLSDLKVGQSLVYPCSNGYEAESKKAVAYRYAFVSGRKFSCRVTSDLTLTVTRTL